MSNITYFLGAGASFYSCPILNKQAEAMINVSTRELQKAYPHLYENSHLKFCETEKLNLKNDNKFNILWYIGYFGKKSLEFNTIDTYAKKLELTNRLQELNLLKMAVSVFFDLWEHFRDERYGFIRIKDELLYKNVDPRYISLMSILLEKTLNGVKLKDQFKFISWNYDLQVEKAFKSFVEFNNEVSYTDLNKKYFSFLEENKEINDIYHLNGHRGFFKDTKQIFEINSKISFDDYWEEINDLFDYTIEDKTTHSDYIKYAWEHDINGGFMNDICNVLKRTDVLVIIGYSFPAFNREIDQKLFSNLHPQKTKKIIYQDPNASTEIIESLFETPSIFRNKIKILKENEDMQQFHIPNEHFIIQKQAHNDIR